jgi:hypothetical protein
MVPSFVVVSLIRPSLVFIWKGMLEFGESTIVVCGNVVDFRNSHEDIVLVSEDGPVVLTPRAVSPWEP